MADIPCRYSGCEQIIPEARIRRRAKYCSEACYTSAYKKASGRISALGVPSGTVGAIGELLVAVDLMRRGFEVFRALSPSCSCDLAVLRDGKLLKIEVRTGYLTANGSLQFGQKTKDNKDHYAVVIQSTKEIHYLPELG